MKRNKICIIVAMALLALTSCVKTECHYVDDSLKGWFVDRDKAVFQVCDQNGIYREFRFQDTTVSMIPGSSYFLFVKTDDDLCENINQNSRVSFYEGQACGLSITNYYGEQTQFSLRFYDVWFDLNVNPDGGLSCSECQDEWLSRRCRCSMELLDSHEVDGVTYRDVIHLSVTDLDAVTRNTFPTELYYAQHYGPIEYELGGNVRCLRASGK